MRTKNKGDAVNMNKKNIVPLGYTMVDGKLVENEFESEVLRFTFERNYYYYLNPPEELIEYFMTQDNTITREDAFELARNSAWIYYYILLDDFMFIKDVSDVCCETYLINNYNF